MVAAPPPGFYENATISARAAYVAGKVVHVYCASTYAVWTAWVASLNDPVADPGGVTTTIGSDTTYLSASVCAPMNARIRKRTVDLPTLGLTIEVLAHEAEHLRGIADEGQAECAAIKAVPAFLVHAWGFRRGSYVYGRVMFGALNGHHRTPPAYRAVC